MRMFELMDRIPSIDLEGGMKLSTVNQGRGVIDHLTQYINCWYINLLCINYCAIF